MKQGVEQRDGSIEVRCEFGVKESEVGSEAGREVGREVGVK